MREELIQGHMTDDPDLSSEYQFRGGERGKYAARSREGTNVVLLDPDLLPYFPDSKSVNDALRALVNIAKRIPPCTTR